MEVTLNLKPEYLQQLQKLFKRHVPWAEIWAYGSRVDNTCHEASDLDLVLRNPDELTRSFKNLGGLKETFSESNLPILVDILDWATVSPSFRKEIEKRHAIVQNGEKSK